MGNLVYWTAMVIGVCSSFLPYVIVYYDSSPVNPY